MHGCACRTAGTHQPGPGHYCKRRSVRGVSCSWTERILQQQTNHACQPCDVCFSTAGVRSNEKNQAITDVNSTPEVVCGALQQGQRDKYATDVLLGGILRQYGMLVRPFT